ncbi:MAG: hypothetical protein K2J72_00690 [Oscillospiraceae bacterium]|nr:hypothetical protein [Oscillospiraceae bacterium]
MSNRFLAITCRVIGIIYTVLICLVAFGALFDGLRYVSYGGAEALGYGLGGFLGYLFVAFTGLILFWSISNILFDLAETKESIRQLSEQNRKLLRALNCDEPALNYGNQPVAEQRVEGGWVCPKCGRVTPDSQRMCMDCGYQK